MTAPVRAGTTAGRTTDMLNAVDGYARHWLREGGGGEPDGELLALRHLVECLTRIVQAHPTIAEFAEAHAAAACEALDLEVEADG